MILRKTDEEELSPIIIYNDHLGGLEYIWSLLEKRFRQAGHRRPLIFKEYDCYRNFRALTVTCIPMMRSFYQRSQIKGYSAHFRSPFPSACFSMGYRKNKNPAKILWCALYALLQCTDLPQER